MKLSSQSSVAKSILFVLFQKRSPSGPCQNELPAIEWATKNNEVPSDTAACPAKTDCNKSEDEDNFNEGPLIAGLAIGSLAVFMIIAIVSYRFRKTVCSHVLVLKPTHPVNWSIC